MRRYNPKEIEPKWQAVWEETKIYQAEEDKSKPKHYVLEYFPYPKAFLSYLFYRNNRWIVILYSFKLKNQIEII